MKNEYKALTGAEYKPTAASGGAAKASKENKPPVTASATGGLSAEANELAEKVAQQGEKVRELKSNKAAKVCVNFDYR